MAAKIPVITIDGPSGSGKGTVTQLLANKLNWNMLDSGALYRVLAYAANMHGVRFGNEQSLEVLANHLDVQFVTNKKTLEIDVILEGSNITKAIRYEEVGKNASIVAAIPAIRLALLNRQRSFRESPGLVADGRDMGSVVFPDAELKFFLEASAIIRAERRYKQLQDRGLSVKFEALLDDLNARDERDTKRSASPLVAAEDAIIVDTNSLNADEVFQTIFQHVLAADFSKKLNVA